MATVFDASILTHFTLLFSMILVMAIMYGILQFSNAFHASKGLHVLIAFTIGLLMILVPDVTAVLGTMIPWFTLLFIFIVMLLLVYKIFGASDELIASALHDRVLIWVIIIAAVIIVLVSFSTVYGQRLLEQRAGALAEGASVMGSLPSSASGVVGETGTPSFEHNLSATFFHPKILGALFLLIIATITMAILAMEAK